MTATDKPSIAELMRIANEQPARDARSNGQLKLRNAAPVLLDIAAAGIRYDEELAKPNNYEATCEAHRSLLALIAKVRP